MKSFVFFFLSHILIYTRFQHGCFNLLFFHQQILTFFTPNLKMSLCQDCVKGRKGYLSFTWESSILMSPHWQVSPTRVRLKVSFISTSPTSNTLKQISFKIVGKWESIGGVDSYIATPVGEYPKNKAILFLTDMFGPQLPNAQVRIRQPFVCSTWAFLLISFF